MAYPPEDALAASPRRPPATTDTASPNAGLGDSGVMAIIYTMKSCEGDLS